MPQVIASIRNLTYVAFADDAAGAGFSLTTDGNKAYMAIIVSPTVIDTPVAGDFTGQWTKIQGPAGAASSVPGPSGPSGPSGYQSEDAGTFTGILSFDKDYHVEGIGVGTAINLSLNLGAGNLPGHRHIVLFRFVTGGSFTFDEEFFRLSDSLDPASLVNNDYYILEARYFSESTILYSFKEYE